MQRSFDYGRKSFFSSSPMAFLFTCFVVFATGFAVGCGNGNDAAGDHALNDTSTESDSAVESDTDSYDVTKQTGVDCEPLEAPTGPVTLVTPDDMDSLQSIVADAQSGDTILFADGTYLLNGMYLWIASPGVTLRSQSGNPENVILDGGYATTEIITVAASDCTVAEMTVRRAVTHPIHVTTSELGDTLNTLIYRMHIIDPGEQAVKINTAHEDAFVDEGTVACSVLRLTDNGRPHVNMEATPCYTGGVDAHQARNWVIRDNLIEGFWCAAGFSEHAVHFWRGSRGTLVERNVLKNNARGVGFGMATDGEARTYTDSPCGAPTGYVGHYEGLIRNNFIFADDDGLLASEAGFDCGVCLWSACGAQVFHNSIVSTGSAYSAVEWRFESSSAEVINNLSTHPLRERDGATAVVLGNVEDATLSYFADGPGGDLHLAAGAAAVNSGEVISDGRCDADIDGEARDTRPDVGADEVSVQ